MKNLKKFLTLGLTAALTLALTACGQSVATSSAEGSQAAASKIRRSICWILSG